MIHGLEHAALSVANLDRSIVFYRDVLGLEVVRILECSPEMGLGKIVGIPGARARIAHLQSGSNMLELFEYQIPRGRPLRKGNTQADHGFIHIGFKSDDEVSIKGSAKKGLNF